MSNENIISATIKKLETDKVIITINNGNEITLPLNYIPADVGEGDVLHITISNPLDNQKKSEQTKELLNEILKPNS